MWKQAKIMIRMFGMTISGFELAEKLSHATDHPREAMATIGAMSVAVVEGFQGKIPVDRLESAMALLSADLQRNNGVPLMRFVEQFKAAL